MSEQNEFIMTKNAVSADRSPPAQSKKKNMALMNSVAVGTSFYYNEDDEWLNFNILSYNLLLLTGNCALVGNPSGRRRTSSLKSCLSGLPKVSTLPYPQLSWNSLLLTMHLPKPWCPLNLDRWKAWIFAISRVHLPSQRQTWMNGSLLWQFSTCCRNLTIPPCTYRWTVLHPVGWSNSWF